MLSEKGQYSMSRDNTAPDRKVRIIALSAMVLALVGGLSLFNSANGETESPALVTEPPTVVTTSCSGFEANAHQLFDNGGTTVLRGTFARGDHVHLAIDLRGTGFSWQSTGALGEGPYMTPSILWVILLRTTKLHAHTTTTHRPASASTPASSSTASDGTIDGYARWEVEFDVATAGDGALTINQTSVNEASSVPLFITPPRVAIASCTASKEAHPLQRGDASSS
jgi:hypothetical protein